MEARLAKKRIVGLQYDAGTIHTGNLNLDFTIPDDKPGHGAYILRNGGGKGVFLQSLFQTLDPLSSWKNEMNRVQHFFFNEEERPMEYTFHVVQEWYVSSTKRVILGFAVTPRLVTRDKDSYQPSPIDLDYILYIKEVSAVELFDIFDLPLWDKEQKQSLPLQVWKDKLKTDKSFTIYTRKDKDMYLEKIEEYGYDANTVNILKKINVGEGGFGEFFTGATDNTGLFYKLIIPTINDKLEGIDSRNKKEVSKVSNWFLEVLKISKELPELMSLIDNIQQINDIIQPLKDDFQVGEEFKKNVITWERKGSELYGLSQKMLVSKEEKIELLEKQQKELLQKLIEAEWKFNNIDYVELCQERDCLDGEYFEWEQKQKEKDLILLKLHQQIIDSKINLHLKQRDNYIEEKETNTKSVGTLLNSGDWKQNLQEQEEIKQYFHESWERIYQDWKKVLKRNTRSELAHEYKLAELTATIEQERENGKEIEFDIRIITTAIEKFQSWLEEASSYYGAELPYVMEDVLAETEEELIKWKGELQTSLATKEHVEKRIQDTTIEIDKQTYILEQTECDIKENKGQCSEVEKAETDLLTKASRLLQKHLSSDMDRDGFYRIKRELEESLETTQHNYQAELEKFWSFQEDKQLIEAGKKLDTYIPNSDLLKVKRLLDQHRIECLYGTEYLNLLNKNEKQMVLKKNPAIRYSIVVLEDNLEAINLSFIDQELLRSYVVLVNHSISTKKEPQHSTNPYLDKQDELTYVLRDKGYSFVEDTYELEKWRISVEKQSDDAEIEMDGLIKRWKQLESLLKTMEVHLNRKVKIEWEQELLLLQNEYNKDRKILTNFHNQLTELEKQRTELEDSIHQFKQQHEATEQKARELTQLLTGIEESNENKRKRASLEELFTRSKDRIAVLENDNKWIMDQSANNKASFNTWYKNARNYFKTIQKMLGTIQMPISDSGIQFDEENDVRAETYPRFALEKQDHDNITKYRELDRDKGSKNIRVAQLNEKNKMLQEKIMEQEDILQQLSDSNWMKVPVPTEDELHLAGFVNQLEKQKKELEEKIQGIKTKMVINGNELEGTKKRLQEKEKDLEKDFPNFGAQYVEIKDCKAQKERYRKQRNTLKKERNKIVDELSNLKKNVEEIDKTMKFISNHGLSLGKSMGALTEDEKIKFYESPLDYYSSWQQYYSKVNRDEQQFQKNMTQKINHIKDRINSYENLRANYQRELVDFLSRIRDISYSEAIVTLDNYLEWADHHLQDEFAQKEKAEQAIDLCVERQTRRALDVIHEIQDIIRRMTIINWKKERFQLMKYNKNFSFPKGVEEIRPLIKEFCLNQIEYFVEKHKEKIDDFTVHDIVQRVNISSIVRKALDEYPRLQIHIPGIGGDLLRGEAKHARYKEWETINQGSVTSSTKSGGQTLLAQFMIIAMLMRQRVNDHSQLFLVSDNPFGTMNASELVEAVFSLLELLNIQWLVVAPPITNVSITSKFPTLNIMNLEMEEGKEILKKKLIKNHRKYLKDGSILEKTKEA